MKNISCRGLSYCKPDTIWVYNWFNEIDYVYWDNYVHIYNDNLVAIWRIKYKN